MPTYSYKCRGCGYAMEAVFPVEARDAALPCPNCGMGLAREFVPTTSMMVPAHMKAGFDTPAAHQKWFHSDETQQKLKSGEYEIAKD